MKEREKQSLTVTMEKLGKLLNKVSRQLDNYQDGSLRYKTCEQIENVSDVFRELADNLHEALTLAADELSDISDELSEIK